MECSGKAAEIAESGITIVAEVDPLTGSKLRHSQRLDWQVERQTVLEEAVKLSSGTGKLVNQLRLPYHGNIVDLLEYVSEHQSMFISYLTKPLVTTFMMVAASWH